MNKRLLTAIIVLLSISLLSPIALAQVGIEDEVHAYLLGDSERGEVLEGYNIHKPVAIASISKLMSYLVIMESIDRGLISLDDNICIDEDITRIKGSSLNLKEGEIFTVKELLESVLVVSANDATYALAKQVAGREEDFVKLMNERAKKMGLKSAYFINSTGLPEGELQNTMNVEDIFKLSRYIIKNYPEVLSITSIPYIEYPDRDYKKENTNPLLGEIEGIDGLKTGFTNKAGYCLVSTVEIKGDSIEREDFRLIGIIMGAENPDKQRELSKKLIQYGMDNYSYRILAKENMPAGTIYIPKSVDKEVEVYPGKNFTSIVKNGDHIDKEIILDEDIKLPLKERDKVGRLIISKNGQILEEMDLLVHKAVEKDNIFKALFRYLKELFASIFYKNKIAIIN